MDFLIDLCVVFEFLILYSWLTVCITRMPEINMNMLSVVYWKHMSSFMSCAVFCGESLRDHCKILWICFGSVWEKRVRFQELCQLQVSRIHEWVLRLRAWFPLGMQGEGHVPLTVVVFGWFPYQSLWTLCSYCPKICSNWTSVKNKILKYRAFCS